MKEFIGFVGVITLVSLSPLFLFLRFRRRSRVGDDKLEPTHEIANLNNKALYRGEFGILNMSFGQAFQIVGFLGLVSSDSPNERGMSEKSKKLWCLAFGFEYLP